MIADIIDDFITNKQGEETTESVNDKKKLEIFKIGFLEQAYELSCYNFDVQISLTKSFDRLGW